MYIFINVEIKFLKNDLFIYEIICNIKSYQKDIKLKSMEIIIYLLNQLKL